MLTMKFSSLPTLRGKVHPCNPVFTVSSHQTIPVGNLLCYCQSLVFSHLFPLWLCFLKVTVQVVSNSSLFPSIEENFAFSLHSNEESWFIPLSLKTFSWFQTYSSSILLTRVQFFLCQKVVYTDNLIMNFYADVTPLLSWVDQNMYCLQCL